MSLLQNFAKAQVAIKHALTQAAFLGQELVDSLRQGKAAADRLSQHLQGQLSERDVQAASARDSMATRARDFAAQRTALQVQAKHAEQRLAALLRQNARLRSQLEGGQANKELLQSAKRRVSARHDRLESQLTGARCSSEAALQQQLSAAQQQIRSLTAELADSQANAQRLKQTAEKDAVGLRAALEAAKQEAAHHRAERDNEVVARDVERTCLTEDLCACNKEAQGARDAQADAELSVQYLLKALRRLKVCKGGCWWH